MMPCMEQLIADIEAYCDAAGIKPQRLLRDAADMGWGKWSDWKARKTYPTMKVVDRVRTYMADHPPEAYHRRKRGSAA